MVLCAVPRTLATLAQMACVVLVACQAEDPVGAAVPIGSVPILVGAGDIADCNTPWDEETAVLLDEIEGVVFTAGDNAYDDGTAAEFADCYGPSWGRHKGRTRPSPGNHDYHTSGAAGYYDYFGDAAGTAGEGYYSYNIGMWHVIALNSNIDMGLVSPQAQWLLDDLESNVSSCTLAYWHHPRFSSGAHGNDTGVAPLWELLYAAGADVVINGHDHDYERFAPQAPDGTPDPDGIREFVVGTGGRGLRNFVDIAANSEVRNNDTFGVLMLTLFEAAYAWEFVPVMGGTFADSGTTACQ